MIHISSKKINKINRVAQSRTCVVKPRGLWYADTDEWLKYYSKNINKINECKYVYELKLRYTDIKNKNENKILQILTESTFDKFTIKYGVVQKSEYSDNDYSIFINWTDVAKDYGGIECIPLIHSRLTTRDKLDINVVRKYNAKFKFTTNVNETTSLMFWLYSFDIASGCVWNPRAVKSIERKYKI